MRVERGALVVVGGHSRGVGKTSLIEHLLRADTGAAWVAIKISAHRHAPDGVSAPLVEEAGQPSALTQTGRYLAAGARRAFLVRAPDVAMPGAAAFIESLRSRGSNAIVESNRIMRYLAPDALLFVVDPRIDDWKPSSALCWPIADAVVSGPPWVLLADANSPLLIRAPRGPRSRNHLCPSVQRLLSASGS